MLKMPWLLYLEQANHRGFVPGTHRNEGVRRKPAGVQGTPCRTPDHGVWLQVDVGRGCLPESLSDRSCPRVCLTARGFCPWQSTAGLCAVFLLLVDTVPVGSPSCGGDVMVYVEDVDQPSLPTPFHCVPVSVSLLWPFQLYFIP